MATKAEGVSCYDKAAPDEPLFVLRASDQLAPKAVCDWAARAINAGVKQDKIDEAIRCAMDMETWGREHGVKVPD